MSTIRTKCIITIAVICCLIFKVKADKTKQALKAIEGGELLKTEEIVLKSIEKDGLTSGITYVYSVLLTNQGYNGYNLDSAYYYINLSTALLNNHDEKELEQYDKLGINNSTIEAHKLSVDSLAFDKALEINSIDAFNYYHGYYNSSKYSETAILKRDSLAYNDTRGQNTWKSYQLYMETYPQSKYVPEAKERYDDLIFEEKTGSGKLRDMQQFLLDHPGTPYLKEIENRIFNIIGAGSDASEILNFLKGTDDDKVRMKGAKMLYHMNVAIDSIGQILDPTNFNSLKDSLAQLEFLDTVTLLPIYERGKYGFYDYYISEILPMKYKDIEEGYFCGNIDEEILFVSNDSVDIAINRLGQQIGKPEFETYEILGQGLIKVEQAGKHGVMHYGGWLVHECVFDDVEIIGDKLLRFEQNGFVGLKGLNGHHVLDAVYDDIFLEGQFWVVEQNDLLAVVSLDSIMTGADGGKIEPEFRYEEVELIDDEFLLGYVDDVEVLMDTNLKEVIPEGVQTINTKFDTWIIRQPFGYRVFNRHLDELTHTLYDQYMQNDQWLALQKNNKWSVFSKSIDDEPIIGVDSVKLLGEDIALIFRDLGGMAIFPNKKIVEFIDGEELRTLNVDKGKDVHFLVIKRGGKNLLYEDGELLFEAEYDEIGYISDDAFYVKEDKKYGAVGRDGRLIMRVRYDAIGVAVDDIAPVLYRGKFGGFNFKDKILLKLDFEEKMTAYGDSLLITSLEGKKGLLSVYNEVVLEPGYDELVYWTDSLTLAKNDSEWSIFNIYTDDIVFEGILDFSYVKNHDEKILKIRTSTGYGIVSNKAGVIIKPTYNDLINLGSESRPLYFGEKHVREADFYVVVYMDANGNSLRSQAFRSEEYDRIVCEE